MSSQVVQSCRSPPDGGWGWLVVFASFMIHIFADGVIFSFGVYHKELVKYFHSSEAATSLIASILVGFTLFIGPVSSALVNRLGCRVVAASGGFIGALGFILAAFAQDVFTLQLTIGVISGAGLGLIYLPATVAVTSYFSEKRALATGVACCGSGFGTFVMAPVAQYFLAEFGWRGALALSGGLSLNCVVFGLLFRPLRPPGSAVASAAAAAAQRGEVNESQTIMKLRSLSLGGGERDGHAKHSVLQHALQYGKRDCASQDYLNHEFPKESLRNQYHKLSQEGRSVEEKPLVVSDPKSTSKSGPIEKILQVIDFSLFKQPIFIIFAFSNFCTSLGFNVPFVYIVSQAEARGIPTSEGSYLLSVIGIANTSGRIILGYLFDKKGINRQLIYNSCLVIGGISTALSVFCTNMFGFALFAVTFGFTVGAYTGLTSVIVVDHLGLERLSDVFGFLLLFQGIANFLGPPITGWLFDATHSYSPGFLVAGLVICLSGLILFSIPMVLRRSPPRPGPPPTQGEDPNC